jgi:methionyl-tRNA formyltransferase
LNIIFAGTPDFAADSLRALIDANHNIVAVYTQPDRPAGRGKKQHKSPVKILAESAAIPVCQPEKLTDVSAQQELAAWQADLMIVAAYGLLLPAAVLTIPRLGCINIHASLLPRWRGAAPIQRAIQAGDQQTGITIMQMDEGLDTGNMLLKSSVEIYPVDTGGSLHDRLAMTGANAILEYLQQLKRTIQAGKRPDIGEPQDNTLACYAKKLSKQEALIDWQQDAPQICRTIRAFNPWPVTFLIQNGERIRIYEAEPADSATNACAGTVIEKSKQGIVIACGAGAIRILKLQLPGAKAIDAQAFFNGGKAILNTGSCVDPTNID